MNIGRVITAVFGILGALLPLFIGVGISEYWERRAAGEPKWADIHVLWFKWAPPLSLAAQRDAALGQVKTYQTAETAARAHAVVVQRQQAAITYQAAQHEDVAQAAIRWRYRTLIQEIPAHVTPADDARYPLSLGFVRIHDAAALGLDLSAVTGGSSEPDDAASSLTASFAATTIAGNYGRCTATAERLTAVQAWIRDQGEAPK